MNYSLSFVARVQGTQPRETLTHVRLVVEVGKTAAKASDLVAEKLASNLLQQFYGEDKWGKGQLPANLIEIQGRTEISEETLRTELHLLYMFQVPMYNHLPAGTPLRPPLRHPQEAAWTRHNSSHPFLSSSA